jgi:hypothetical protein
VTGLSLFFGSAGTAITNRYMPDRREPPSAGWLVWNAHRTRHPTPLKSRVLPWVRRTGASDVAPR